LFLVFRSCKEHGRICLFSERFMDETQLYEEFEDGTLDAKLFSHAIHIKTAWLYLKKFDLPTAISAFSKALKNFAKVNKADKLYHETITFAFLILINQRMVSAENQQSWEEFSETNADLFDWKNSVLKKYYRDETIKSAFAKKHFVFPDKLSID
jgi:hypothetical protein